LPATEEAPNHFAFSVRNQGKLKGFLRVWMERVAPRKARVPQPNVIAVRVANLFDKDFLLALDQLLTEAWRCQAPKELDPKKKAPRRGAAAPSRRS